MKQHFINCVGQNRFSELTNIGNALAQTFENMMFKTMIREMQNNAWNRDLAKFMQVQLCLGPVGFFY